MCSRVPQLLSSTIKVLCRSTNAYTCRILEPSAFVQRRKYSSDNASKLKKSEENEEQTEHNLSNALSEQFRQFRDEDAEIIFDVDEEMKKMDLESIIAVQEVINPYEGLNMERGVRGVYDIEDLLVLLRREKAKDIFVAAVPSEMTYVDYIVITTGKSHKHMNAMATFVRKVFKKKCHSDDILPKIEGEKSKHWIALDLGNIALHIFAGSTRRQYDLETLWTVGPAYDEESNGLDAEKEFTEKYNKFLEGLDPINDASIN